MEKKLTPNDHWQSEIASFLKGELSFEEEKLLQSWIDEDIAHLQYFEEIRSMWLSGVTFATHNDQINQKWEKFNFLLNQKNISNKKPHTFFLSTFKRIASIAAVLIIGMVSGILLYSFLVKGDNQKTDELCEMITPLGAKSEILLPDGTRVWLNAGSKLSYKKSFNTKDRVVSLQGEAFFKVKTNKEKPFIVQTNRLNVRALGTSFNVKAYPEDKSVTATLVEGIIQVNGSTGTSKTFNVTLKPSQSITVDENSVRSKALNPVNPEIQQEDIPEMKALVSEGVVINSNLSTEKFTSWKDNQWIVEAENLEDLAVLLSRKYNVEVHIGSDSLRQYRFTGTIRNETLEQVLEILKLTTPLKYQVGKGEVWWDLDPRLKENFSRILVKTK